MCVLGCDHYQQGVQFLAVAWRILSLSIEVSLMCNHAVTRDVGLRGFIRRTAPFNHLLRQARSTCTKERPHGAAKVLEE